MDKIEKPVVYTMIRPVCSEREGKYVGCYIAKESDKYWEQEMFVKLRKLTLENEDLQRELEAQKQKLEKDLSIENIEKVVDYYFHMTLYRDDKTYSDEFGKSMTKQTVKELSKAIHKLLA